MKYQQLQKLSDADFRTTTGFKRATFQAMLDELKEADARKMRLGGRPAKNPVEDKLLMACQYWREYRTYLHIGGDFGVSKSRVCDTVKWVEDVLIKCGRFSLPGRRKLAQGGAVYEAVLIDATESPIQRPKKNKNGTTRAKKSGTR